MTFRRSVRHVTPSTVVAMTRARDVGPKIMIVTGGGGGHNFPSLRGNATMTGGS